MLTFNGRVGWHAAERVTTTLRCLRINLTEQMLRADLDVLRHGGQEAVTLFLEMSQRLHEAGKGDALHDWVTIAAPALPERERAEVMTLLMYGYLYMNYQMQPPEKGSHSLH